ncbi:MAG: acetyltransferase [Clostridia bacterium]|nr:acetyltransferase [Clostridia bacterium]MBQ1966258.1 acetyltransferase [Clostridia bacterium]
MKYSPSECLKNAWSLLLTKLFFRPARLIRRPVYLRGKKGMVFGPGFTTGYRCRFDLFGPHGCLKIGTDCKLGDNVHIVASKQVTIGDHLLSASNVFISDTNHGDGTDDPTTPPDARPLSADPVTIGNNVWIGEGVAVLPGASIGDGCMIGAHAVVKGKIPAYSVAVGSPARVVKTYNFEEKRWERC